jgi:hypothetical protein
MPDQVIVQPNLSENLQDLKDTTEQKKLLEELGLVVPANLNADEQRLWDAFIKVLYHGYLMEVVDPGTIEQYFEAFASVPTENKSSFKTAIYNLIEQKVIEQGTTAEIYEINELDNEINEMALLIPEEDRERFIYYMNTGEGLTDEEWVEIQKILSEEKEYEAVERLEKALNRDEKLNIGLREIKSIGLSPEELTAKFDLDGSAPQAQPQIEGIPTASAQSLYQAVEQKREEAQKNTPQNSRGNIKPKGLDELLS